MSTFRSCVHAHGAVRALACLLALQAAGCSVDGPSANSSGIYEWRRRWWRKDAGVDAGPQDAGSDAQVGATDAGSPPAVDAGQDAGLDSGTGMDAGTDAGVDPGIDAGLDAGMDAGLDPGIDAGLDAGIDAGLDAGIDAGLDAGIDAGLGAGIDAGTDAGIDAGLDAGTDAGLDAGTDAGLDAGTDAGLDAGTDAALDAGTDAALDAGTSGDDAAIDPPDDAAVAPDDAGALACPCTSRDLGPLPPELDGLTWPALPTTTSTIDVSTDAELRSALDLGSSVTVRVHGDHAGTYTIRGSDVEVVLDPDASIESLLIAWSQERIRISGGTYDTIQIWIPIDYNAPPPYVAREELMVSDVTIECVTVRSPDTAFFVHGRRIAILGADVVAERYSLFTGIVAPLQSEDVIVARSVMRSAGPEATARFRDVRRAVVARSRLENPSKHNWRVHGIAERVYLGDTILVGSGVMLGNQPGDSLDRIWFVRSTLHYTATSGIAIVEPSTITNLTIADDVFYSDTPFALPPLPADWTVTGNTTLPYQPPPAAAICR